VAIVFPVSAFVASGFEHSVANMYFIPLGIFLRDSVVVGGSMGIENLTCVGYVRNLVPVALGNIMGGSGLVALIYYVIYRRHPASAETPAAGSSAAVGNEAGVG
jgi:formate/nitrite transporter FocA (FNT family)